MGISLMPKKLTEQKKNEHKERHTLLRQWRMIQTLASRKNGMALKEMSAEFGVTILTIRKDIAFLQTTFGNFNIEKGPHGVNRYYFIPKTLSLPLDFNKEELAAFAVARLLMRPLDGTWFTETFDSGYEKIERSVDRVSGQYARCIADSFHVFEAARTEYDIKEKIIQTIMRGIEQARTLKITYRSLESKKAKTYEIHPYHFVYANGILYVVGLHTGYDDIRQWRVDRFNKALLLRKKFIKRLSGELVDILGKGPVPYRKETDKPISVKVLFEKCRSRMIMESKLKMITKKKPVRGGRLLVDVEVTQRSIFYTWILGFGGDATIVGPSKMRAEVMQEGFKIWKNNGGKWV